jgi:hypothetical protein
MERQTDHPPWLVHPPPLSHLTAPGTSRPSLSLAPSNSSPLKFAPPPSSAQQTSSSSPSPSSPPTTSPSSPNPPQQAQSQRPPPSHPPSPPARAIAVASIPPLFFVTPLYYTDALSTALVLVGFSAALRRRPATLALAFAAATAVRQTNIVWLLLASATVVLNSGRKGSKPGPTYFFGGVLSPFQLFRMED